MKAFKKKPKFQYFYPILLGLLLLSSSSSFALTILVDPGHGGEDDGAKTSKVMEKDLALEISTRIYKLLKKKYNVFLSRSVDRTVSLQERADLAEKIKADILISIHLNSASVKSSQGFEIYYLDNHNDAAVKKVEEIENTGPEGTNPVIQHILTDLVVERTVESSKKLANSIYETTKKEVLTPYKMRARGVRPGLFYVLALSKRPGVLIEVGFLSNQNELKKMSSSKFQQSMAKAVSKGVDKFVGHQNIPLVPPLF